MDVWQQIKEKLGSQLPWESFQSWFASTAFRAEDGARLFVSVPNLETREWIEREFASQVMSAVHALHLRYSHVEFVVSSVAEPERNISVSADTDGSPSELFQSSAQLNDRYTFENFVVGTCNQFAHAAARAAAEQPARRYNPLFIYGGSGQGKTHLLHAIGTDLLTRYPKTRVVYTTAERFMNQLVQSIRGDRMAMFHQHYRSADVLLVDDVQILAGKERTQEEFFHTFNELYDHHKQVVLTSDAPPKETNGLVERLRSRFEWGLLVDVQAPDLETKLAILSKKASLAGVLLPPEVLMFVANKSRNNVRELESALLKLVAQSSVTNTPITVDMARQALRHLSGGTSEKKITLESIMKCVADHFQIPVQQLKQKSNRREVAFPRQVGMYVAKELTPASLPEIGRAFGGKHHTTVMHSIQKIERERMSKLDINRSVHTILDSFN
ncbi:MAG: chromosomal replication initiator protein DnaA [Acidobacteria bacterium]|nr:chromosomal replication initiator protein DnaA [Acidobacteriota bacterium]